MSAIAQTPTSPDQRIVVKREAIFEPPDVESQFRQCHASTIVQTPGGLVAAWFGGTAEGKPDVRIWLSRHDGRGWSPPEPIADGIQHDGLRYPCWNPVLFHPPGGQTTLCFYKVGPKPDRWWGEVRSSTDNGRSWSETVRLPDEIIGPVRSRPLWLAGQDRILLGSSTEDDGWKVHFESIGWAGGALERPWRRTDSVVAEGFEAIQPTLLSHGAGRLQSLCRTRQGKIVSTFSDDEGRTWTPLQPIDLPNPNSAIEALTLAEGTHWLVANLTENRDGRWGDRASLTLLSSPDGIDWTRLLDLRRQPDGEFSYPAMIQTDDGMVHITYTHNRQTIEHLVLDPGE